MPKHSLSALGTKVSIAIVACMVTFFAAKAPAIPVPMVFASYQNANFNLNNNGSSAVLTDVSPALSVTFIFDEAVVGPSHSYAANQPISATVTLTNVSANGAASSAPVGPLTIIDQPISGQTWSFTDQYGENLLTISNFAGDLIGASGGETANLAIDTTLARTPPDTLTYSSDFLSFSPGNVGATSSPLTLYNATTLAINGADNQVASFQANVDGSFSAPGIVSIPEPATFGLLCLGGVMLMMRRRH